MLNRVVLSTLSAVLVTGAASLAVAAPGNDTTGPTSFNEGTNPAAFTLLTSALYANDDRYVANGTVVSQGLHLDNCNGPKLTPPAADCTTGTAGQNANSICPDVNGPGGGNNDFCNFPYAVTACTVGTTVGGIDAGTCVINGSGNLTVDLDLTSNTLGAGPLFVTYTTATGTATVTGLSIAPVTDTPVVTHTTPTAFPCNPTTSNFCLIEDEVDKFSLGINVAKGGQTFNANEILTQIVITGVPTDAILECTDAGVSCSGVGTTWTVTGTIPWGAQAIALNLPAHRATFTGGPNPLNIGVVATAKDSTASTKANASHNFTVTVDERADTPLVTPAAPVSGPNVVSGVEDAMAGTTLGFAAALVDTDLSENLVVTITNVPAGGELTAGTNQGGGTYDLTPAELATVGFRWTTAHLDTNTTLTLNARANEIYSSSQIPALTGSSAVATRTILVEVNAVADKPSLTFTNTATGPEDTFIPLTMNGNLVDTDGSETLFFFITVPNGGTLNVGTDLDPGGLAAHRWMVAKADIANVQFKAPPNESGVIPLSIRAGASETRGTCAAGAGPPAADTGRECVVGGTSCAVSCTGSIAYEPPQAGNTPVFETINVTVTPVADTPNLNVVSSSINLNEGQGGGDPTITSSLVDLDLSETCSGVITWTGTAQSDVTGSFSFSAGMATPATTNSWTVPDCNDLTGITVSAPNNGHGTFTFCIVATSREGAAPNPTASTGATDNCFDVVVQNTNLVCGDDFQDTNEACDYGTDNANASNTCRTNCTLPSCGDGIPDGTTPGPRGITENEQCDQGGNNSNTAPDTCRTDCRNPFCGDNVKDMFEACDDGNNGIQTDNCLNGCLAAVCGDNVVWAGVEECDTGLARSDTQPDACRTTCLRAHCTDGVTDTGEACDDGNALDTDACPTTCQLASCGDGFTFAGMEACDEGANNSNIQPNRCRTSCVLPRCGDLVVDSGEACDDGNAVNEDPCVNTCELNVCGDGFVNLATEACDEGDDNSNSVPDACRPTCVTAFCGDGVQDSGESCDLGVNNNDNDPNGCKTNCALPGCGDGVIGAGEQCDDGAANSNTVPNACRLTCTRARCGDGVRDMGEVCDDGPANSNNVPNACRTTCRAASCGDRVIDAGETCDNGMMNSNTTPGACRTTCVVASCGDGVVDPGEGCDDGTNNSDVASGACRTTCVIANCGDGVVDPGEACDDGAANGTDPNGCETDCTLPPACGDGVVDAGEECDDGALNSDTQSDACRSDCTNPLCGDGVVDSGEECDAGMVATNVCDSDCVIVDDGEDMGGGDDMGNNNTPDVGNNNPNNGTPDTGTPEDMGGSEEDTGGGGPVTTPTGEGGCCRTVSRTDDDSSLAGWLAMIALGLVSLRRRR